MTTIRVTLFGKMDVDDSDGASLTRGLSSNAQKLLAYVLLHRSRSHARERLGSLLWEHGSTRRCKAYLRKAIWQIQHLFDDDTALLSVDGDWVQLNGDPRIWLDVAELETAVGDVRDRSAAHLTPPQADALRRAVDLYTGDLLEHWYADWCLLERERLRDLYLMALKKLSHYAEYVGNYDEGVSWGARMLAVDPARECAHRQLMRLRYLAGDRTGALRQYARCAGVLDAELGVRPSEATRTLHTRIQNDAVRRRVRTDGPTLAPPSQVLPLSAASSPPDLSTSDGVERIRQMQRALAGLQSQIQQELKAIEVALSNQQ